jgi:hypothetical protein
MTEQQADRLIQQNNLIMIMLHANVNAAAGHTSVALLGANKALEINNDAMELYGEDKKDLA